MTDIVERLREAAPGTLLAAHVSDLAALREAANEIELRRKNENWQMTRAMKAEAETERLRNEVLRLEGSECDCPAIQQADEIVRLRAEIEWMHTQLSKVADIINSKDDKQ